MTMNLENVFRSINKKMLIDFDEISAEITHRGAKGKVRELEILKEYLSKYVPGNIGIANGEIISVEGHTSSETDIVLYEKNSTPYLLKKEGYQIFPIECVYAVIEVKSHIDKGQLIDAFKKINYAKKMPKKAYEAQKGPVVNSTTIYDREWPYFPTIGLIIGFDSIDLKTLRDHYVSLAASESCEHRIDSIWVLKKGMIINYNTSSGLIELAPSKKTVPRAILSDNPLMLLTIQLQSLLISGWMPHFMLRQYLAKANYGNFYD
jgi:hypothetical protein